MGGPPKRMRPLMGGEAGPMTANKGRWCCPVAGGCRVADLQPISSSTQGQSGISWTLCGPYRA